MSYSELRLKDVINICDGRKLGRIIDLHIVEATAQIQAIVVPGSFRIFDAFCGVREGIVIPWKNIRCIGDDVVLVDINDLDACPCTGR